MDTVLITSPIEVITLSDRSDGRLHSSNFEQELEPGTISKFSKSTDLYKRLLLWRSRCKYWSMIMCLSLRVFWLIDAVIRNPLIG